MGHGNLEKHPINKNRLSVCNQNSGIKNNTQLTQSQKTEKLILGDAGDIIEALVNNVAKYDYFTNLESYNVFYPYNYVDTNFPFNDTNLFHFRNFCFHNVDYINFCLSPAHISYYAGNEGAIYMLKDLKPPNKDFAYCSIVPATWSSSYIDEHVMSFVYGNPIERP